jgi:hypothetical protein
MRGGQETMQHPFCGKGRKVQPRILAVFLAFNLLGWARSPAFADGPGQTDALIEQGLALREQGRDREALALFEHAHALDPSPRAEVQVALAQQALGRWLEAEQGLLQALATTPRDPWIERNRPALEQALATVRNRLAWLTVDSEIPGTEVRIEGRAPIALPMLQPLRVPAGAVVVEARAAGYEPIVRTVEIHAGERARLEFLLAMAHVAPGASTASPIGPEAWILLGTAGAFLAGGVAANVVRETYAVKYDSQSCISVPGKSRDDVCGSDGSTARTATVLEVVGYSAAGVAAAATAYLFLAQPAPARRAGSALSRCGIGPMAVTCSISF